MRGKSCSDVAAAAREVLAALAAERHERRPRRRRASFSRHARSVALLMFVLNAPQRPRSAEKTRKSAFFSGAPRQERVQPARPASRPPPSSCARPTCEHLAGLHRVRAQRDDALLRAREPRARDHLHRARDLLRRLRARDALADRPSATAWRLLLPVAGAERGRELVERLLERAPRSPCRAPSSSRMLSKIAGYFFSMKS